MDTHTVECLRCGNHRELTPNPLRQANPDCPRCGYIGWAPVGATGDRERRLLRRLVLELVRPTKLA
ncbi:MAG TPA: hypothetical protein VIU81_11060 [Gaiellaceae bacterium]